MNEVNVLRMVTHPCVVRCFEHIVEPNALHIVMEFVGKGDLFGVLEAHRNEKRPLTQPAALRHFAQICLALRYVHACGILYRDLKTANIFVTNVRGLDYLKLGDFGISKVLNSPSSFCSTVVGTPYYLSPEICTGMRYNVKSDSWALGCVLYKLCSADTGRRAFEGNSLQQLVLNIMRGEYKPLDSKKWSVDTWRLLHGLLQVEPKKRYSVRDALCSDAVRGALEELRRELHGEENSEGSDFVSLKDVVREALSDVRDTRDRGIAATPFVAGAAADAAAKRVARDERRAAWADAAREKSTARRRARDEARVRFLEQAHRRDAEKRFAIKHAVEARAEAKRNTELETRRAKAEHARRVRDAGPRLNRRAMNPAFLGKPSQDIVVSAPGVAEISNSKTPETRKAPQSDARVAEDVESAVVENAPEPVSPPPPFLKVLDPLTLSEQFEPAAITAMHARRRPPVAFDVSVVLARRSSEELLSPLELDDSVENFESDNGDDDTETDDVHMTTRLAHIPCHCIAQVGVKQFSKAYRAAKDGANIDSTRLINLVGEANAECVALLGMLALLENVQKETQNRPMDDLETLVTMLETKGV